MGKDDDGWMPMETLKQPEAGDIVQLRFYWHDQHVEYGMYEWTRLGWIWDTEQTWKMIPCVFDKFAWREINNTGVHDPDALNRVYKVSWRKPVDG